MSAQNLIVSENVEVWLTKAACRDLVAAAESPLLEEFGDSDGVGYFSASEVFGRLNVSYMTAAEFSRFAELALAAAEQSEWIKPHQADLQAALEADPRFKH